MNIIINGSDQQTEKNNLLSLLEEQNIANKNGIAVAVNECIIPKSDWKDETLKENDKITVITATAGG